MILTIWSFHIPTRRCDTPLDTIDMTPITPSDTTAIPQSDTRGLAWHHWHDANLAKWHDINLAKWHDTNLAKWHQRSPLTPPWHPIPPSDMTPIPGNNKEAWLTPICHNFTTFSHNFRTENTYKTPTLHWTHLSSPLWGWQRCNSRSPARSSCVAVTKAFWVSSAVIHTWKGPCRNRSCLQLTYHPEDCFAFGNRAQETWQALFQLRHGMGEVVKQEAAAPQPYRPYRHLFVVSLVAFWKHLTLLLLKT